MSRFAPIVAPITTAGGAVGGVRVSGEGAWSLAARVFSPWPDPPRSLQARYGQFATGEDGLVLPFAPGHGYTSEEAVECFVHGSPASLSLLVEAFVAEGARAARPGEFTERAFLHGRLDLAQAEAVADLVAARTERQLREAGRVRAGALGQQLAPVAETLTHLLATVEASVDFEEEVGPFDPAPWFAPLREAERTLDELIVAAERGRLVREGVRVAIVGRPNVGKSSLLNRLLGRDRAIVTPHAGTTRDTLEEGLVVAGVPVVLTDTAGLREAEDPVERIGVARAREAVREADLVWHLYDAGAGWTEEDQAVAAELPAHVIVAHKADLARSTFGLPVSSHTGEGVPELLATVAALVPASDWPAASGRALASLRATRDSVSELQVTLAQDLPPDLSVTLIRSALNSLGEVTGEGVGSDFLEQIFARFCIGK